MNERDVTMETKHGTQEKSNISSFAVYGLRFKSSEEIHKVIVVNELNDVRRPLASPLSSGREVLLAPKHN